MSNNIIQSIFAGITLIASAVYNSAVAAPSVRQLGVGSTSGMATTKATTTSINASRSATKTTPAVKKIISATPAKTATTRTTATASSSDPIRLVGLPVSSGNNGGGNTTLGVKTGSMSTVVFNTQQRVQNIEDALASAATKDDMNNLGSDLRLETAQAIVAATDDMAANVNNAIAGLQNERQVEDKISEMTADFQTGKQVQNKINNATKDMVTTSTLNSELANSEKIQGMESAIADKVSSDYVDYAIDSATSGVIKDSNLDDALADSVKIRGMESAIADKVSSDYVDYAIDSATSGVIKDSNLDAALADSAKIRGMESAIADKVTLGDVNTAINNSEKFGDYYTKNQIDADFIKDNALSGKIDAYVSEKDIATKTDVRNSVGGLTFRVSGDTLQSSTDSVAWKDVAPLSAFGGTPGCSPDIVSNDDTHTITISGCGKPEQVINVASIAEDTTCKNNEVIDVKLDPTNSKKILVSRCNSSNDEEITLPEGGECDNYLTDISLSADKKSITAKKCGTPITPIQICESTTVIDYDEDQGCTRKATKDCNGTLTFIGECLSSGGDICPSATSPEYATAIKSITRSANSMTVKRCNDSTEEIPLDNCPLSKMVKYQKPGESSACWRKMTTDCSGNVTYDDCETLGGSICSSSTSTAIKNIERGTNGITLTKCDDSVEQVEIPQQCELQITASRFDNKMVQDVQKSGMTLTGKCNGTTENLFSEDIFDAEATVDAAVVESAVTTKLNALGLSADLGTTVSTHTAQITALQTDKHPSIDETHKLQSSLVSFTEGERGALDSGITATKVSGYDSKTANLKQLAYQDSVNLGSDVSGKLSSANVDFTNDESAVLNSKGTLDSLVAKTTNLSGAGTLAMNKVEGLGEELATKATLTNGRLSSDVIPDLSGSYAKLTSGKISSDVVPELNYQAKGNYATLNSSNKLETSVIPDLSGTYASSSRVTTLESTVGDNTKGLVLGVNNLNDWVGTTSSTGLRGTVATLNTDLGTLQNTVNGNSNCVPDKGGAKSGASDKSGFGASGKIQGGDASCTLSLEARIAAIEEYLNSLQ